jgi:putative membrane protein
MAFGIEMTARERPVALFTFAYVIGFSAWFILEGNTEFVVYLVTMLLLIALVGRSLRSAAYPTAMLWALSLWGLLHMAGGGVPVGGAVLYNLQVIPLGEPDGEWTFLKYDQLVHAYGFGVAAWVLWHLMRRHYPMLDGSWTILVYPALAAMGLGAVNEIIEFMAVLSVPDTNVGGYLNTALDLCFNAAGAVIAMILVALLRPRLPSS